MASILEFRTPALQCRQVNRNGMTAVTADIVLFPGVRYERWAEDEPEAAKPKASRRRHEHLTLDD
jgi:hypothetical protein